MSDTKLFASSTNGDLWSLETIDSETVVIHVGNEPSGGHQTRTALAAFLKQSAGKPEHSALLQVLGQSQDEIEQQLQTDNTETSSHKAAMEYLRLGGRRLSKVDDNIVSIRAWDTDPAEAETFWQENVETLDDRKQQEVVVHLPSISDR